MYTSIIFLRTDLLKLHSQFRQGRTLEQYSSAVLPLLSLLRISYGVMSSISLQDGCKMVSI